MRFGEFVDGDEPRLVPHSGATFRFFVRLGATQGARLLLAAGALVSPLIGKAYFARIASRIREISLAKYSFPS
jgi:hypothetical protein